MPKFVTYESSLMGLILNLGVLSISDADNINGLSDSDLEAYTTGVLANGLVDTSISSAYAVPTECDDKVAPYKIAIIPDTVFTRSYFLETMDAWYPRIDALNSTSSLQIPSFRESIEFFDSEDDLEDYVSGSMYGDGLSNLASTEPSASIRIRAVTISARSRRWSTRSGSTRPRA